LVGSVTKELHNIPESVTIIPFAKSLDDLFDDVKVAICPMFRGTGMKIKVVEAMAYGVPIVCNERGVDGFPDKRACGCIVTNDAQEFADAINRLIMDADFYEGKRTQIQNYYQNLFAREQYKELLNRILLD
jgi:glycosyltransferase involved in cell wall biosynthesis